jgi:hypothetical protein
LTLDDGLDGLLEERRFALDSGLNASRDYHELLLPEM